MNRFTTLALFSLTLLSACSSNQYPMNWAKPALGTSDCSMISGVYSNDSIAKVESSLGIGEPLKSTPLTLMLMTSVEQSGIQRNTRATQADRVEMSVPRPGVLAIRGYGGDYPVAEYQFSEKDKTLQCGPAGARLTISQSVLTELTYSFGRSALTLSKNERGELMARNDYSELGLFLFVVPVPHSGTDWYRFAAYVCDDKALQSRTSDVSILRNEGYKCYLTHDLDSAIAYYQRVAAGSPYPVADYAMLGKLWYMKSDFDHAVEAYDRALAARPESGAPFYWRGKARIMSGQYDAAVPDISRSLALGNERQPYGIVWKYIARSRSGNQAEAERELVADAGNTKPGQRWPDHLIRLFQGQIDSDALFKAATESHLLTDPGYSDPPMQRSRICEADLFLGEWHLIHSRKEQAKEMFLRALEDCERHSVEYIDARTELQHL